MLDCLLRALALTLRPDCCVLYVPAAYSQPSHLLSTVTMLCITYASYKSAVRSGERAGCGETLRATNHGELTSCRP